MKCGCVWEFEELCVELPSSSIFKEGVVSSVVVESRAWVSCVVAESRALVSCTCG